MRAIFCITITHQCSLKHILRSTSYLSCRPKARSEFSFLIGNTFTRKTLTESAMSADSVTPDYNKNSNDNERTALVLGAIGLALSLLCCILILSCIGYIVCHKSWKRRKPIQMTNKPGVFNPFFTVDDSKGIDIDYSGSATSS